MQVQVARVMTSGKSIHQPGSARHQVGSAFLRRWWSPSNFPLFLGGHQSRMVSTVVKHVSIVSCISSNASSSSSPSSFSSSSSSSFSFDPADAAERVKEYIGVRLQMIVCYIFCYLHLICCHVFSECTVQCQEISTPPAPPAPSLPSIQRSLHVHGSSVDDGSPVQDLPN